MEHIEQAPSPEYLERFNQGYLIAKYKPELAENLNKALEYADGFDGFKAGMDEYALEQKQQSRYGWLSPERSAQNKDADAEKEKDDLDRE